MVDFRRAFDVVPFQLMLRKLEKHGVTDQLLAWFGNWTEGRQQRVVINGLSSEWADVISSVVQGSVIGPVLFLIFINDIDMVVGEGETKLFKYADDTKFGRRIQTHEDAATLQICLDDVTRWADRNGMSLHPLKTTILHFGHSNPRHHYTMNGAHISSAECVKDLGVLVNEKCTPSDQVEAVVKRANSVLAQIRRATVCRDLDMIIRLYKTYVRPQLETSTRL